MCAIILIPYYKKASTVELDAMKNVVKQKTSILGQLDAKTKGKEEELRSQEKELERIQKTKQSLSICHDGLNRCQVQLAKTFLMVKVSWDSPLGKGLLASLNLTVTDAKGRRFSWDKTNQTGRDYPDTKAQLSISTIIGPGTLVWIDPDAKPGDYTVEYELSSDPNTEVTVRGAVFDRYGRKNLPAHALRNGQLSVPLTIINLSEERTLLREATRR